jgi:hypothetical protein
MDRRVAAVLVAAMNRAPELDVVGSSSTAGRTDLIFRCPVHLSSWKLVKQSLGPLALPGGIETPVLQAAGPRAAQVRLEIRIHASALLRHGLAIADVLDALALSPPGWNSGALSSQPLPLPQGGSVVLGSLADIHRLPAVPSPRFDNLVRVTGESPEAVISRLAWVEKALRPRGTIRSIPRLRHAIRAEPDGRMLDTLRIPEGATARLVRLIGDQSLMDQTGLRRIRLTVDSSLAPGDLLVRAAGGARHELRSLARLVSVAEPDRILRGDGGGFLGYLLISGLPDRINIAGGDLELNPESQVKDGERALLGWP